MHTDILKKNIIDNPASRIVIIANSDIQMRMDENKHIICQIVCAIYFLGMQGFPCHGDNEDLSTTKKILEIITSINQGPRMPLVFSQDLRIILSMLLALE